MSGWRRFWIGGGGALLPLLVTLLAVDLASIIDHARDYSYGIYVGTAIRYFILFVLGGVVAAANSDETKPIKLVQLGIAAPALIASYINAQGPASNQSAQQHAPAHSSISAYVAAIIPAANALEIPAPARREPVQRVGGFFDDIVSGATNNLGTLRQSQVVQSAKPPAIPRPVQDRAALEAAMAANKAAIEAAAAASQSASVAAGAASQAAQHAATAANQSSQDTPGSANSAAVAATNANRSAADAAVAATKAAADAATAVVKANEAAAAFRELQ